MPIQHVCAIVAHSFRSPPVSDSKEKFAKIVCAIGTLWSCFLSQILIYDSLSGGTNLFPQWCDNDIYLISHSIIDIFDYGSINRVRAVEIGIPIAYIVRIKQGHQENKGLPSRIGPGKQEAERLMEGEKSRTGSKGYKRKKSSPDPRPIQEYDFFVARDGLANEETVPADQWSSGRKKGSRKKGASFFLTDRAKRV